MSKHFEGSLTTRGVMGGSVVSFTMKVKADQKDLAEQIIKERINQSRWLKEKYLQEGAQIQIQEVNGQV